MNRIIPSLFLSQPLQKHHQFTCSYAKTVNTPKPRGKLLIIPTPIGNLGDLSPNIIKALYSADLIGC